VKFRWFLNQHQMQFTSSFFLRRLLMQSATNT